MKYVNFIKTNFKYLFDFLKHNFVIATHWLLKNDNIKKESGNDYFIFSLRII